MTCWFKEKLSQTILIIIISVTIHVKTPDISLFKCDDSLLFFVVFGERTSFQLLMSVRRKKNFAVLFTQWQMKTRLIIKITNRLINVEDNWNFSSKHELASERILDSVATDIEALNNLKSSDVYQYFYSNQVQCFLLEI